MQTDKVGIGISFGMTAKGDVFITGMAPNGPAKASGIPQLCLSGSVCVLSLSLADAHRACTQTHLGALCSAVKFEMQHGRANKARRPARGC